MHLMMIQLRDLHFATAEDDRPNDFYAGALAVLVVIMFAKFVAHNHSSGHIHKTGLCGSLVGPRSHRLCIGTAWLAMWLALATLAGWSWFLHKEQAIRVAVFILLVMAATLLSLDIGFDRSSFSTGGVGDSSGSGHSGGAGERQNSTPT